MTRRDMLVAMIQALFLALFPWLRTDEGVVTADLLASSVLQTDLLISGIGLHIESEPMSWYLA